MRTKLLAAISIGAAMVLPVVFIATRNPSPTPENQQDSPDPAAASAPLLDRVYARFDPTFPGRGVTDYPGATVEDIPKSYAMMVLAELERGRHGIRPDLPNLASPAGHWLLDNAALNLDGTKGWGLPVAWDAYGDGSENPAGTVYAISTAIVADALMTWMETTPEAPGQEIIATLSLALDNFARAPATPDGLIPYSLQPSDQSYDTFNSAAYLAGQMQRFAKYAPGSDLAKRLTDSADATVASLLTNRKKSPSRSWYWLYSIQDDVANDMPHASYIIEGLRTYVGEGGALSSDIKLSRVVEHLSDFFDAAGRPRGWPTFQTSIDSPPRLYDVGIALSLACSEPEIAPLADMLMRVLGDYSAPGNAGFLKYPVGTTDQVPLVVNEYEVYLWRGLVSCASDEQTQGSGKEPRPQELRLPGSPAPAAERGKVPFVHVGSGIDRSELSFRNGRSILSLPWSPGRRVVEDDLVLQAIDDGAGGAVVTRGFPNNDLALVTFDESEGRLDELTVRGSKGSAPILRAASFYRGVLYVVYYDSPSLKNYLSRFERRADGYVPLDDPLPLPSFEDPAGGTYEMVPAVYLVGAADGMYLLAGTFQGKIDSKGSMASSRIPNCLRVLEAVAMPNGPVALCLQKEEQGRGAPYELHGPGNVSLPQLEGKGGGRPLSCAWKMGAST